MKPLAKNVALADQLLAVLRDAEGFPLSTHAVARALGEFQPPWSYTMKNCWCAHCGTYHGGPVWRNYSGQDIRPVLVRLLKSGDVERVVLDSTRWHYWRSSSPSTGAE